MRKIYPLIFMFAMCALASCGNKMSEIDPMPDKPIPPVSGNELSFLNEADLKPIVSQDGGTRTIVFTAKECWTACVSDSRVVSDWLAVSPTSGEAGEVILEITTLRNETTDDREGFVKIESGKSLAIISVTQKQRDALTVSPSRRTIEARETEFDVEVCANVKFEVEVRADWIEWIKSRSITTTTLKFRAGKNIENIERSGSIIIRSGEKSETIVVTQEKGDFIVDRDTFNIDATLQSVSAKVRANIDLDVKPQVSWIHYTPTRVMIENVIQIDVDENTTGTERKGEVEISCNSKKEIITIVQDHEAFRVDFTTTNLTCEGGKIIATVKSNLEYSLAIINEPNWIVREETRAVSTQNIEFHVRPNTTFANRKAVLRFMYQSEEGEKTKDFTIIQNATNAGIATNKDLFELDSNEGRIKISIEAKSYSPNDIEYYIKQGVGWISRIESRISQSDFVFLIDKNETGELREGEIAFVLPNKDDVNVKIIQMGNVEEIYFPDENFRQYLLQEFDINGDGIISKLEATFVKQINCPNQNIKSIAGIENFTSLTYLDCSTNQIKSIDISGCKTLAILNCVNNPLELINLGDCNITQYDSKDYLDLSGGLSTSTELKVFGTKLQCIDVSKNNLQSLDISGCPDLTDLSFKYNPLKLLNLGDCNITQYDSKDYLDLSGGLRTSTELKVFGTKLQCIDVSKNNLRSLDISGCPALVSLKCNDNNLTGLNLSNNTALQNLDCSENTLASLDVSASPVLAELNCNENKLTSLNLSNNTALQNLNCSGNALASLDVSASPILAELNCNENKLTSLNLSNNTALKNLNCSGNTLASLDVSASPILAELNCNENKLTSLNLSNNTALKNLNCSGNTLASLDVSTCRWLTDLNCESNKLTSLNINNCIQLCVLMMANNESLTTANIASNHKYMRMYLIFSLPTDKPGVGGIVVKEKTYSGGYGLALSLDEISADWYDAVEWCSNKSQSWSLPGKYVLQPIYKVWSKINTVLETNGFKPLTDSGYWSSTEYENSEFQRYYVYLSNGSIEHCYCSEHKHVRAAYTIFD